MSRGIVLPMNLLPAIFPLTRTVNRTHKLRFLLDSLPFPSHYSAQIQYGDGLVSGLVSVIQTSFFAAV